MVISKVVVRFAYVFVYSHLAASVDVDQRYLVFFSQQPLRLKEKHVRCIVALCRFPVRVSSRASFHEVAST